MKNLENMTLQQLKDAYVKANHTDKMESAIIRRIMEITPMEADM